MERDWNGHYAIRYYLFALGLGEEVGGFGSEGGEGAGVVVVGEVAIDDEGDLDWRDLPLSEVLGLLGLALLRHGSVEEEGREEERERGREKEGEGERDDLMGPWGKRSY